MRIEPHPDSAYTSAIAGESFEPDDGYYDQNTQRYNNISFDDLEMFARIVAYKVAKNISNGYKMDPYTDPLLYVDCEDYPCLTPKDIKDED